MHGLLLRKWERGVFSMTVDAAPILNTLRRSKTEHS